MVSTIYDIYTQHFSTKSAKVSDKIIVLETKNGTYGINEINSKSSINKNEGKIYLIISSLARGVQWSIYSPQSQAFKR